METDKKCKMHPHANVTLTLTPTLKHHGRWDCSECGKFVVWAKSPKTCDEMQERKDRVLEILDLQRATLTLSDFKDLCDIYAAIHLNLVQQDKWMRFNTI